MTTTTILMLCLVAFLVIIFYKIFISQTDEIPTNTELKPLPPRHKSSQNTEINPVTDLASKIKPKQHHIFAKHWGELAPKSIWGVTIAEPYRNLISAIIYPFVLLLRLLKRVIHYTIKVIKFILEIIVEIVVELIFNIILRGIFLLVKGFFHLIFRMFDGI